MNIDNIKRELRARIRQMPQCDVDGAAVTRALCSLEEYKKAKTVFVFVSTRQEPETRVFIEQAISDGKIVTVPKCSADGTMEARQIRALTELEAGMYGILEPGDNAPPVQGCRIDFAVVPGLCFDMNGGRLGKGGGYYDKFLQDFTGFKAGLCPAPRLVPSVPMGKWDVCMDMTVVV